MIQQKVDDLFLLAMAATLQTAVVLLTWMRRSETGNLPKTEAASKAAAPGVNKRSSVINVFSVDLEDYFHPTEVARGATNWAHFAPRIEIGTDFLLELLEQHRTRATFFVLGWVADKHPSLVQKIAQAGHEIGCHSYHHRLVFNLTPAEFREDTLHAIGSIEDACGVRPKLYRAPSYSIVSRSTLGFGRSGGIGVYA